MTPDAKRRIQIARTALLLDQPFFGVLALRLVIVCDDTPQVTMWTDGRSIGYSPAFVESLSNDELLAVLAHEVLHCACGHPWRRDNRAMLKWNRAADYAINDVLKEAGFRLPSGALLDPHYSGKSSEWIYDRLDDDDGDSDPQPGEVRDVPDDGQPAPTEADWQQVVQQALKAGKAPASLTRSIGELTAPIVDWRATLRKYIQDIVRSDYTWQRPNPRYIAHGLYLPTLRSIECPGITVAIDTSGSIDDVLLKQFASEMQSIADEVRPRSIDVYYCDAAVNRVDRFERDEPIVLHACGGGGTAFAPVFKAIDVLGETPAVVVYLTDLDGSFPDQAPDYPVIWVVSGRIVSAPFGDVIPCNR